MEYGYARVSAKDQNLERQVLALHEAGLPDKRIFQDKKSGKDFERAEYRRLMRKLRSGDVLFIKSIDRLGRNYDEILEQWRCITKEKGAAIVVLDMPLLDTRNKHDLTGTLIADLVLQILSYVAQIEREFIKQRQAEGIAAAKAKGVQFGPSCMPVPENLDAVVTDYEAGMMNSREAAAQLNVSQMKFLRWYQDHREGRPYKAPRPRPEAIQERRAVP